MKNLTIIPKYICPNGTMIIYMLPKTNNPYGKPYIFGNANNDLISESVLKTLEVDKQITIIVDDKDKFKWTSVLDK
jgi:hypothetical protein